MSNVQNVFIGCKQEVEENLIAVLKNENVIDYDKDYFFIVNVAYDEAKNICSSISTADGTKAIIAEMLVQEYPSADYFGVCELIDFSYRKINCKKNIDDSMVEWKEEIKEYYLV